jgi:hypothetical protein
MDGSTPPAQGREKKRGGRPALPEAERRGRRYEVFVSPSEDAALIEGAAALGQSVPAFLRDAGLRRRPRPRVPVADARLSGDLKRVGNLLDQLAAAANSGRIVNVATETLEELSAVCDVLAAALLTGPRNDYEEGAP